MLQPPVVAPRALPFSAKVESFAQFFLNSPEIFLFVKAFLVSRILLLVMPPGPHQILPLLGCQEFATPGILGPPPGIALLLEFGPLLLVELHAFVLSCFC